MSGMWSRYNFARVCVDSMLWILLNLGVCRVLRTKTNVFPSVGGDIGDVQLYCLRHKVNSVKSS